MWRNMYRQIDRSPRFGAWLQQLSNNLARRRGLPIMIAIALVFLSLIVHLIADVTPASPFIHILADLLLHIGILTGLIGILLSEAVGRG